MWSHVVKYVANMWACEQAMQASSLCWIFVWLLSIQLRVLRYFVLSALDIGEYKHFNSIYSAFTETGVIQTMQTNQKAELKQ